MVQTLFVTNTAAASFPLSGRAPKFLLLFMALRALQKGPTQFTLSEFMRSSEAYRGKVDEVA